MPVDVYTQADINAAIARLETAKQNHPTGFSFLRELHLKPEPMVSYAMDNAALHVGRLERENDPVIIYTAAWLNGLGIGIALGEGRQ